MATKMRNHNRERGPGSPVILCGPRQDCVDPNPNRWHCMRGHDGAAPGICPLVKCDRQGANHQANGAGDGPESGYERQWHAAEEAIALMKHPTTEATS